MEYLEMLERQQQLVQTIAALTAEERSLREQLFAGAFPEPTEGTNTYELPDGRKLKGVYKLNRKVDAKAVHTLPQEIIDKAIRFKPELSMTGYKELSAADKKKLDRIITATPGLPSFTVVPAKSEAE